MRRPVPRVEVLDPAVFLIAGQSNAGNHGRFTAQNNVFNFNPFDGQLYQAADPLLGATGSDGSPWCPLGDRLVAAGFASSIVLCPIAVGGASVLEWAPSGQYNHRLADALERLRKTDLWPTHVIWHQGEADALAGLPGERYRGAFLPFVMTCGKVASINPPLGPKRIGIRAWENCGGGIGQ